MNLSQYIKLERGNASSLAIKLDISMSYLSQLAVSDASVSPARCVEIEQATNKQVSRQDLRPDDWQAIWPELVTSEAAPVIAAELPVPRAEYVELVKAGLVKDERQNHRRAVDRKSATNALEG